MIENVAIIIIYSIVIIEAVLAIVAILYKIFYRKGFADGFKDGVDFANRLNESTLHEYQTEIKYYKRHIDCLLHIKKED